jgi:hypothetical protein
MKILSSVIFLVFVVACGDKEQRVKPSTVAKTAWTEEQKRQYFNDSIAVFRIGLIDSSNEFPYFFKKHYPDIQAKYKDAFLYALEEQIIDTTKIDTAAKWFRLTIEPCFRLPHCLIVEKYKKQTIMTTKATNGDGGYNTGTLALQTKFFVPDTVYDNILNQLRGLNFWSLGDDTTCHGGLDGETWIFESIDKGRYNVVTRWVPQSCGNRTTKQLAQLGIRLREVSRLEKVLAALGQKSGM